MVARRFRLTCLAAIIAAATFASTGRASSVVTYIGTDVGVNQGGAMPNSDAAAASFTGGITPLGGPSGFFNFESSPVGPFSSLPLGSGVTLTGSNSSIQAAPGGSPSALFGYNTTPGGTKYVQLLGGTVTFAFTTPIQAFGSYITGVQLAGETITFSDGSSQSIPIPNPPSNAGGVSFVGFTDISASISSVTIHGSGDIIGVDDVTFVNAPGEATPLPGVASAGLVLFGLLGAARYFRKPAIA